MGKLKRNINARYLKERRRVMTLIKYKINEVFDDPSEGTLRKSASQITILIATLLFIGLIALVTGQGDKLGTFGDFLGGVANPILTFFTFICLIKTIFMQREELILSRKELALTRDEYAETKSVIRKQSVESTFYNGVNLHHEIVNNLKIDLKDLTFAKSWVEEGDDAALRFHSATGRDCFKCLLVLLTHNSPDQTEIIRRYTIINNSRNEWFGHYFRNLYRIIKIIDDLPNEYFTPAQKREYCHTLRAQLSSNELAVLMLNCYEGVCDRGEFQGLLSRYAMLEHLALSRSESRDKVIVVGSFEVSFSFIGSYLISDDEIRIKKSKLDLRRHPGYAFGKNSSIIFPKRFSD